jgi:hypothetical protein
MIVINGTDDFQKNKNKMRTAQHWYMPSLTLQRVKIPKNQFW